jgi:hypothetical protein
MTIYSCYQGDSSEVFPKVLDLWVPQNSWVYDMTYGKGTFWRHINGKYQPQYRLKSNDIDPDLDTDACEDCRTTGEPVAWWDAVVFDPPWGTFSTTSRKDGIAENYNCPAWGSVDKFLQFCSDTAFEAKRILKRQGIFIVKCQDSVNSGKRHWISNTIMDNCAIIGLIPVDRFVQMQKAAPVESHGTQRHSRLNHSFYLVFRKR